MTPNDGSQMTVQSVLVKSLRPTQIAVGYKLVKAKRKGLQAREKKPQELVDFILANPIRAVVGPENQIYVVDHHHLAHALLDEGFKTAPVIILDDLSTLAMPEFWKAMEGKAWLHPFDGKGQEKPFTAIPNKVSKMEDDPYRSLAGFVRLEGGFEKTQTPFAEFVWADFYRKKISLKELKKDFDEAVKRAKKMASNKDASGLPGYIQKAEAPVKTAVDNT